MYERIHSLESVFNQHPKRSSSITSVLLAHTSQLNTYLRCNILDRKPRPTTGHDQIDTFIFHISPLHDSSLYVKHTVRHNFRGSNFPLACALVGEYGAEDIDAFVA